MGYMVHHTIVVSSSDSRLLRKTWRRAKEVFSGTEHHLSTITPMAVNGERSYFVAPDGSKAGWDSSVDGWKARKRFVAYLKGLESYPPDWVLVQFAGGCLNTCAVDSSNHYDEGKPSEAPMPKDHRD